MAYIFGDGFDAYATVADATAAYWDGGSGLNALTTGRFSGSRAASLSAFSNSQLIKNSAANDAVHHLVFAFFQNQGLGNLSTGASFQLSDGANAQCTVSFIGTGNMVLYSGAMGSSTVLAQWLTAVPAGNMWIAYEIEIVIHNTAGSITVRRNGNTTADFTATGLNTRGGSTNNYANRLTIGMPGNPGNGFHQIDDFIWRSDASSVAWMGDVRCYTRMPSTTVSAQFAVSPTPVTIVVATSSNNTDNTAIGRYNSFTPTVSGTIGSILVSVTTGFTGNMKCSIFANFAGPPASPGAILGSATTVVNPVTGNNTFTFGTPVAVTKGTQYWFGISHDVTATLNFGGGSSGLNTTTIAYATFPVANPAVGNYNQGPLTSTIAITPTNNADYVNEAQQDGATSYVYDSTVNDADFYNLAPPATTPASILMLTTRGFMQKSDAGARTASMQLKSGNTVVPPTTWNPADLNTTTLSGSNLIATSTAATNSWVRSVYSRSSGKFYWEITPTVWVDAFTQFGICSPSITPVVGTAKALIVKGGAIYINGSNTGRTLGTLATGNVIGIAWDAGAQLIWFRQSPGNNWNGNAGTSDPATGVDGISTTAAGTSHCAFVLFNTTSDSVTANFGGSSFAGAAPAGFALGFGPVGTVVAAPTTTLPTNFAWVYRNDLTDPNTSSAWTNTNANAVTIGPLVVS